MLADGPGARHYRPPLQTTSTRGMRVRASPSPPLCALALAGALLAGCGGAKGAPPVPSPTAAAAPARSGSDVITAAELPPGEHRDVYEAVA